MRLKPSKIIKALMVILLIPIVILILKKNCSLSQPSPQSQPAQVPSEKQSVEQQSRDLQRIAIEIPADSGGQAELTKNYYFIMDGSGSMRDPTGKDCGGDKKFPDKISGARWAIKTFLNKVPADVNIGLYLFDNNNRNEMIPLGKDNRDQFIQVIDRIYAGDQTPLAAAIRYGTDRLVEQYKKQLGYGEFRLLVVTDGLANGIPEAAVYAAQRGVPIYAIGLCIKADHPLRQYALSYRAADNFEDLRKSLEETLAESPNFDPKDFPSDKVQP